ncbi:MAG: hypothetical protein HY985_13820 [Magnetospirillum sp.]|nr:hypothetical protein [Magnetospirillum sp.]
MRLALLLALLLLAVPAFAQQASCRGPEDLPRPRNAVPLASYEFRRTGERSAGCVLPQEVGSEIAAGRRRASLLPCLKIGPVAIGASRTDIETLLGPPAKTVELDGDSDARVYFIAQRSDAQPYFVVTYLKQRVVAVQLAGPPTEMPLTFSSVSLGDGAQQVIDVLGLPARRCVNPDRGGDTWFYAQLPFALDLINGIVVGLKVTIPEAN